MPLKVACWSIATGLKEGLRCLLKAIMKFRYSNYSPEGMREYNTLYLFLISSFLYNLLFSSLYRKWTHRIVEGRAKSISARELHFNSYNLSSYNSKTSSNELFDPSRIKAFLKNSYNPKNHADQTNSEPVKDSNDMILTVFGCRYMKENT